jgi:hypothetical protein
LILFVFCALSMIQCSYLKNQSTALNTIWNLAGTALEVLPQFHNYFLCYPIFLCNSLISVNHHTVSSRDGFDLIFLNDDQELRSELVDVPISFLSSISSGTRHSSPFLSLLALSRPLSTLPYLQIRQIRKISSVSPSTSFDLPVPSADIPRDPPSDLKPYSSASTFRDLGVRSISSILYWGFREISRRSVSFVTFSPNFCIFADLRIRQIRANY